MNRVVFLNAAEEEMLDAAVYYENQVPGLGMDFLTQIENAVQRIKAYPESGKAVRGKILRRLVRRFPFGILYRVDPSEIVVVAVMHLRRRPGYWKKRIE
jgi:toxin ParE1/3/4